MRLFLITATIVSLAAVAACNQADEPAAPTETAQTAEVTAPPVDGEIDPQAPVLKAEEAYGVRHERFEEIGDNMKAISRELKAGSPDAADVRARAERIAELAPQVVGWFPEGSGPESHPDTRVKAEVFQDEAGFRQAAQQFVDASRAFELAAQSGNVETIRAALPDLGNSCKNCHDKYRGPER